MKSSTKIQHTPVEKADSLNSNLAVQNHKDASRFPAQVVQGDTGLGTAFERWSLNRLLIGLHERWGFESLVEGPDDGMTGIAGINSLALGMRGISTTLLLPGKYRAEFAQTVWEHYAPSAEVDILAERVSARFPFEDESFDLAWNFNVMTRHLDASGLLSELKRVSRKFVLIFVPNRHNYGFGLHRYHHRISDQAWDHGKIELMEHEPWQEMFQKQDLRVVETGYVDCPWWPDIVDPAQMLVDFYPFLKRFTGRLKSESRGNWTFEQLPYYDQQKHPKFHSRMARLAFFENSSSQHIKKMFAHHLYILGAKREAE
jgi:hypothetical protein